MSLKDRKEDLNNFYSFWFEDRETWIYGIIIFSIFIGLPLFGFGGIEPLKDITLFQIMIPSLLMAVYLFVIFSFHEASSKWRRYQEKNDFVDSLINGDPVDAEMATRKYRNIIVEEMNEDDLITVTTKLGDQNIKVGNLPDHTINLSFNPIDIYNELKNE